MMRLLWSTFSHIKVLDKQTSDECNNFLHMLLIINGINSAIHPDLPIGFYYQFLTPAVAAFLKKELRDLIDSARPNTQA